MQLVSLYFTPDSQGFATDVLGLTKDETMMAAAASKLGTNLTQMISGLTAMTTGNVGTPLCQRFSKDINTRFNEGVKLA